MQPPFGHQLHLQLLAGKVTLERFVRDQNVQTALLATVLIASRAPVLPFARLPARPFLPHVFAVVETLGRGAVRFEGEVFLRLCKKHTQRVRGLSNVTAQVDQRAVQLTRIVILKLAL